MDIIYDFVIDFTNGYDEELSEKVQEKLFSMGIIWPGVDKTIRHYHTAKSFWIIGKSLMWGYYLSYEDVDARFIKAYKAKDFVKEKSTLDTE